jgi:hypothetical protein
MGNGAQLERYLDSAIQEGIQLEQCPGKFGSVGFLLCIPGDAIAGIDRDE